VTDPIDQPGQAALQSGPLEGSQPCKEQLAGWRVEAGTTAGTAVVSASDAEDREPLLVYGQGRLWNDG
jgi:hypothetical protein